MRYFPYIMVVGDENMELNKMKAFFETGATVNVSYRIEALKRLKNWILHNEKTISNALYEDLRKSETESYMSEIGMALSECNYHIKHCKKMSKKHYVKTPLAQFPSISYEIAQPYGVVLVMAPWNYPFMLNVDPLIGAIAAGNCVVVKPSAYAKATSKLLKTMVEACFDPHHVCVVEGGREENQALLKQAFDYIFFTGSVAVGKEVMRHASAHLTPITLELGGKSPCFVDETCDLHVAVSRIVFGKYLNSGQTCVAPDYVLLKKGMEQQFYELFQKELSKRYGKEPLQNEQLPKMINEKHFNRLVEHIKQNPIKIGGAYDAHALKIEPTITKPLTLEHSLMQEEVFGPILPVVVYETLEEAVKIIQHFEHPLAFYVFSSNKKTIAYLHEKISFGGGCINDTIIHLASNELGFGGVGMSGMGSYHGKKSFSTFSHTRSIVKKATWLDLPIRYLPYTKKKDAFIRKFMK